jgi:seryl-tRNA synthetase
MNDLKWIEANIDLAKRLLKKRGGDNNIDKLVEIFKQRRELILSSEELKQRRNLLNELLRSADKKEIDQHREKMRALSLEIKEQDKNLSVLNENLATIALAIPNIPREDVPDGMNANDNQVITEVLPRRSFDFKPRDHVELAQRTDTIDFMRAAKISGSRFAFLTGAGARLNRALLQFFCDYHVAQGDIELTPPYMVRAQAMVGVGQFPKFIDDVFKVEKKNDEPYYLIPTAEAVVTNFLADEIIEEALLPVRYCAYSPCFRSEAGAAGQDTKGLIRMHQFEKVEMVRFAKPEQAIKELNLMVERASILLTMLELPHRIVELCGGDLGFSAEKTFDLEVYLPGQNAFREISSCSSFGSFQARRAKIRMRLESGKIEPLITLNGSGLPLGRTIVAIFENHQEADGSICIPNVLKPYMAGLEKIKAKKLPEKY